MTRLVLIGSYPIENFNGFYYAPQYFIDYWENLADHCNELIFFATINEVVKPQYKSKISHNSIIVKRLRYLSKDKKDRTIIDYLKDQWHLYKDLKDSIGFIESFPSGGGIFSLHYLIPQNIRRLLYMKVDWTEQVKLLNVGNKSLRLKLKLHYLELSKRFALRRADVVLVRGEKDISKYKKFTKKPIIHSSPIIGFTNNSSYARKDSCNGDEINVLFVGDLTKRKRPGDIIPAISFAEKLCPSNTFNIIYVGKEHESIKERITKKELLSEGKKYRLKGSIKFLGYINDIELLGALYIKADIFILPSMLEGFPRVVNEALLFSLPSIITEVGGIKGSLVDRKHVLFFKPQDINGMAKLIKLIVEDSVLRKRLIKNGHLWAQNQLKDAAWSQHLKELGIVI